MTRQWPRQGLRCLHRPRLTRGLVGCWLTDDSDPATAPDHSGKLNAGTITGAAWAAGNRGRALDFDGLDDGVTCGNADSLRITGNITIDAWIYPHDAQTGQILCPMIKDDAYQLTHDHSDESYCGVMALRSNAAAWYHGGGPVAIPQNAWSHFCGVYDGTNMTTYLNGAVAASRNIGAITISDTEYVFRIGRTNGTFFYDGLIEDVRIWNRALSAAEIKDLYFSRRVKYGV